MEIPKVYFGAADRQMEAFIDKDSFQESLIFALIFQGDVVITDIYFYVSNYISDILNSPDKDFFLTALQCGAIIPSFRNSSTESFVDNYISIEKEKIVGILPESFQLAGILQDAVDKTTRFKAHYWGNVSVGEEFTKTVQNILLSNNNLLSDKDSDFLKVWKNTNEIRHRYLNIAIEEGIKQQWGLRRSEIYNTILKSIGLNDKLGEGTEFIVSLKHKELLDNNIDYFLKWVNYCYHYNQGISFGLQPSLPKMDRADLGLSNKFCPPTLIEGNDIEFIDVFSSTFRIPSVTGIFKIPAEKLWAIRNGEFGALYFKALYEWQINPTEESAANLLEKLKNYTELLTESYIEEKFNLFSYIKPFIPTNSRKKSILSDLIYKTAGGVVDSIGNISLISELISGVYKVLPQKSKYVIAEKLAITKPLRIDLTKKSQKLTNLVSEKTDTKFVL